MKLFGKNRDRAIDTLLRAYVPQGSEVSESCPEFDPDLTNAYVEGRLTTPSLSRYEEHLSGCAACRKNVVALSKLVSTMTSPTRSSGFRSKPILGALSRPQWALAAAAVIVLVISLPLLLSRSRNQLSERLTPAVAEQRSGDATPTATPQSNDNGSQPALRVAAKPHEERNEKNAADASKKALARATSGEEKLGARSDNKITEESKQKSETESASQVAAVAAPESREAKSDSDRGRQQQQKDSAQGGESKGRADEAVSKESVSVTAAAPAPPPAPRARVLKPPAGKLALRDNASADSVKPAELPIHGKKFLWKDGAWTDKEFDPDKGLPVVTIIRGSNVYNEVVNKFAALKRYLDGIPETQRAIIVYKGSVYKLIPQQSEK